MKKNLLKKGLVIMATLVTAAAMCFTVTGCGGESGGGDADVEKITVVQQYGMAYAPFQIMEQQKLVENAYKEATGKDVEVEYTVLNSGSTINDSFLSGDVQVGAMGVAPAVTGVMSNVGYKICSNMSAQPHKLMTVDENIKTLADIKSDNQIALVNIGSIQHILLAMACDKELGDARALDGNLAPMAHPDGMTALVNKTVSCQLTTSPYTFKEEANKDVDIREVKSADSDKGAIEEIWPEGNSFIVAVASEDLYKDNPELYAAVNQGISDAIDYINNNKEEAAGMLCEKEDVDAETMLGWLNDPACVYSTELKGVMDMADFMDKNGFLEVDGPKDISDLVFDGVKGN